MNPLITLGMKVDKMGDGSNDERNSPRVQEQEFGV